MKRKLYFTFFFLTAVFLTANAQLYFNAGIGTMNYAGDLQERKVTFIESQYGLTFGGTYQITPHIFANADLTFGKVHASDSKNGRKWVYRNLDFSSNIFEAAATIEGDLFDITANPEDENSGRMRFTPYGFIGLGLFNFNPYTHYQGQKVYLAPLRTEGEVTPYPLWGMSIPFGLGIKYAVSDNVTIAVEMNYRKTNTDHLDDVSAYHYIDTTVLARTNGNLAASLSYRADELPNNATNYKFYGYRGDPTKKDNYYCFLIKVIFRFGEGETLFKYGYGN